MVKGQLSRVLGYIRTAVHGLAARDLTDMSLLERFAAEHDDAAFEMLVKRHAPMVQGVCRRVLGHAQNAEDAFQATTSSPLVKSSNDLDAHLRPVVLASRIAVLTRPRPGSRAK